MNGATCRDRTDKQTDRQTKIRQTVVSKVLGVFRQVTNKRERSKERVLEKIWMRKK